MVALGLAAALGSPSDVDEVGHDERQVASRTALAEQADVAVGVPAGRQDVAGLAGDYLAYEDRDADGGDAHGGCLRNRGQKHRGQ